MRVLQWLNRHIGVAIVLALMLPFLVVGASVWVAHGVTRLPADAAFRVDGVVVPTSQLDQRVRVLGALYGLRPLADPGQQDTFRRATAKAVATSMVLDRLVVERGLAVGDEQGRALLAEFVERGVNPSGQASFVQLLRDTGASETDVLDELKRRVATTQLMDQVTRPAAAEVDEGAVRTYYQQHQSEIVDPEQRHLRNVVVRTEDQAKSLLNELNSGSDFGQVARRSTLDASTRDAGGDLGLLTLDRLQPEYGRAAFAAPANSLFGPVRTPDGWNVGQVLEVKPATPLTFEQVHDRLATQLRARKAGETWERWLDEQMVRAEVTYAPQYEPAAPAPEGAEATR